MAARILSGTEVARAIRSEVAIRAGAFVRRHGRPPGLGVVLVGDDPASAVYVGRKEKASAAVGVRSVTVRMPASARHDEVMEAVARLNDDPTVDGFLVQSPLPPQVDGHAVIDAIDPAKDADGFHPLNVGRALIGLPGLRPCTPAGVVELLRRCDVPTRGRHVVVVGRSNIVGKPLAALLVQKADGADATVTVCHSRTSDLSVHTRRADILVAALGRPRAIGAEMVRPGAVVIDVGIHRVEDPGAPRGTRLVGDVDFGPVSEVAAAITPVPGGIGPMTVAMLLVNTVTAAEAAAGE